jgi:hypothetical protein
MSLQTKLTLGLGLVRPSGEAYGCRREYTGACQAVLQGAGFEAAVHQFGSLLRVGAGSAFGQVNKLNSTVRPAPQSENGPLAGLSLASFSLLQGSHFAAQKALGQGR